MGPRARRSRTTVETTAPDGTRVTIRVFPQEPSFVRDVERVLAEIRPRALPEEALRRRLEHDLRQWYPMVGVRRREDLAEIDAGEDTWYAMRDGRVNGPRERVDHMYEAISGARTTSERSKRAVAEAKAAMERAAHRGARRIGAAMVPPDEAPS